MSVLALGTGLFAGVQIEPQAPRWEQTFVVRITPDFPRGRLFPNDRVFVILEFLEGAEFRYEIVPSSSRMARAFGVEAYPSHYIIDGEGNIVRSALGAAPKTVEILGNILQSLLSDKPFPVKGLRKRPG